MMKGLKHHQGTSYERYHMQIVKKNSYSHDEIVHMAYHGILGTPARMPKAPMLMIDRILDICDNGGKYNKGYIVAELDINPDLWFFDCHFHTDPVMPGCLGVDALWQLVGFFPVWAGFNTQNGIGRALGVGKVKFKGQIQPDDTKCITYHLHIKRLFTRGTVIVLGDGWVETGGQIIYTMKDLKCGLFQPSELRASLPSDASYDCET